MLNYKHLHYFWVVAKEGSIARASERLHLTLQTICGQLSLLEEHLGEALFTRVGRNLELTETGRLVLSYADEPIPPGVNVLGFNHPLGECGITFFTVPRLARKLSKEFPQCLSGAPLLLPGEMTVVQGRLLQWFDGLRIHPRIVDEFDDRP
jgi:hypothetical protein